MSTNNIEQIHLSIMGPDVYNASKSAGARFDSLKTLMGGIGASSHLEDIKRKFWGGYGLITCECKQELMKKEMMTITGEIVTDSLKVSWPIFIPEYVEPGKNGGESIIHPATIKMYGGLEELSVVLLHIDNKTKLNVLHYDTHLSGTKRKFDESYFLINDNDSLEEIKEKMENSMLRICRFKNWKYNPPIERAKLARDEIMQKVLDGTLLRKNIPNQFVFTDGELKVIRESMAKSVENNKNINQPKKRSFLDNFLGC